MKEPENSSAEQSLVALGGDGRVVQFEDDQNHQKEKDADALLKMPPNMFAQAILRIPVMSQERDIAYIAELLISGNHITDNQYKLIGGELQTLFTNQPELKENNRQNRLILLVMNKMSERTRETLRKVFQGGEHFDMLG